MVIEFLKTVQMGEHSWYSKGQGIVAVVEEDAGDKLKLRVTNDGKLWNTIEVPKDAVEALPVPPITLADRKIKRPITCVDCDHKFTNAVWVVDDKCFCNTCYARNYVEGQTGARFEYDLECDGWVRTEVFGNIKFPTASCVRRYLKLNGIDFPVKIRYRNNPFGGEGKWSVLPKHTQYGCGLLYDSKARWHYVSADNNETAKLHWRLLLALRGTNGMVA